MEYPFQYPVEIDGWTVAYMDGIATITRCCVDPDDWEIECVEICEVDSTHRWVPSHPFNKDIERWLYNTKAQQITEAWADRAPDVRENAA